METFFLFQMPTRFQLVAKITISLDAPNDYNDDYGNNHHYNKDRQHVFCLYFNFWTISHAFIQYFIVNFSTPFSCCFYQRNFLKHMFTTFF